MSLSHSCDNTTDNQEKLQWTQGQAERKTRYRRGKSHFVDWIKILCGMGLGPAGSEKEMKQVKTFTFTDTVTKIRLE